MTPFSLRRTIRNTPIPRKLSFIIGLFCAVIFCLFGLSYFGMDILSSERAFVGGEALWSKAQKQAVIQLGRYAWSRNEREYQRFLAALQIPLGDHQARLELEKLSPDYQQVTEGFLRGGNDRDDIPGMIRLVRQFGRVGYIRQAVEYWRQGDAYLSELVSVGEDIHREITSNAQSTPRLESLLLRAQEINIALTPIENSFSSTLGEAARWLKGILLLFMTLAIGFVLAATVGIATLISRYLVEEIDQLRAGAAQIAKGDYSVDLNIDAQDEVGDLARSFQWMAGQRQQAEKLKDEFFSNVSHELRTPLTLILSPLESLLPDPRLADPTLQALLQTMHNNTVRLLQLVNGLLDFSKLEAGQIRVQREPLSLARLMDTIHRDFQPLMHAKKITSTLRVDPPDAVISMDRYLGERILFNLISNAVKFTPEKGRVDMAGVWSDGRLTLTVSDSGIGIPPHNYNVIFQRFRQVEGSSTRRFEGTGLGLALVKEFAELLGGTVSVESAPGQGSTFTVTCLAPAAGTAIPTPEPEVTGHMRSTQFIPAPVEYPVTSGDAILPRVLIAEDNSEMAGHIASILSSFCRTKIVHDGQEALKVVKEWHPELILTDVMMPEVDGLSFCREIKSHPETLQIPVVMLTALTHRQALLEGWKAGADEYLFKPFHPEELIARVRSLLKARQDQKEARDALHRSEERYRQLVHSNIIGFMMTDGAGRLLEANDTLLALLGYTREEFEKQGLQESEITPSQYQTLDGWIKDRLLSSGVCPAVEKEFIRKDGSHVPVLVGAIRMTGSESQQLYFVVDVTERRTAQQALQKTYDELEVRVQQRTTELQEEIQRRQHAEEELRNLAIRDPLTSLYNRRGFMILAEKQLQLARRRKVPMLLFMGDLDDLKTINDQLGHAEGDLALTQMGELLRKVFRESDVIARLGGDEFAVAGIEELGHSETHCLERLQKHIEDYNRYSGRHHRLHLSVGVARISPDSTETLEQLMQQADAKLYDKKKNKNPQTYKT